MLKLIPVVETHANWLKGPNNLRIRPNYIALITLSIETGANTIDPDQNAASGHCLLGGSVGCTSDWWSGGCRFDPRWDGKILSWRLIMKYFLRSFSPFRWFKKGSCQLLAKECTILVNRLENQACPVKVWLGKLTALDMTPLGLLGHKDLSTNKTNSVYIAFHSLCSFFKQINRLDVKLETVRPEQTMKTQIRRRLLRRLIRVYTVCHYTTHWFI